MGADEAFALPYRERTLGAILERQAGLHGDRILLRSGDRDLSYAELRERASALAGALTASEVGRGDRVAIVSGNRVELLEAWLACAWIGAALVPVNTALRGPQLEHVLRSSAPRILIVEAGAEEAFALVADPPGSIACVWTVGDGGTAVFDLAAQPVPEAAPIARVAVDPEETCAILFTSGTTGPSKGVQCPQAQFYWWGLLTGGYLGETPDDVLYSVLPLFHTNALNAFCQALLRGATFVVGRRFHASTFWQELESTGATVTYLLGAMVEILLKAEPSTLDRAHRCRVALAPGTPAGAVERFRQRFGIELVDAYGSTETNIVLCNTVGGYAPGTMGRVVPGFEARVVDPSGAELADGAAGELVVRASDPCSFATGYFGMPEATAAVWRDGWFQTGDRVMRNPDGTFSFVDRLKDVIRRRGENISSFEVEQALLSHPNVSGAAAVPVPSELGDDEVLAFVVLRPGASLDPIDLMRHLEPRLAYFAIPRYVERVDELPLTESGKIRKFVLRERGVGPATWDREAAGYVLAR